MSASHSLFKRIFYFASLPYRLLNFSIRPLADISRCLPVKKGWHLEQTSTRSSFSHCQF